MFWIDTEIGWYYKKCVPFLSSSSYAKHGRNAVNIPLANSSIFGPDNWINSRIQSMAVNWINGFLDWAWFIRMLHISDIFVPDGSLLMPFKNSDSSVSHLFHKQFWALEEHFRTYKDDFKRLYVRRMNFDTLIVEHLEKTIKNLWKIWNHIYFGHSIQYRYPSDYELSWEWIFRIDSFTK